MHLYLLCHGTQRHMQNDFSRELLCNCNCCYLARQINSLNSFYSLRAKRGRTKRGRSRDPEIPGLEPLKAEKTEKPEFRIWTPENRKRRKNRKNRNSGSGPLKTGKGGKHGKDGKSGCAQNPRKSEENELRNEVRSFWLQPDELRNKVRNCWHAGPETTENGKRNLKKGLCSRDTFGAATFGGLGFTYVISLWTMVLSHGWPRKCPSEDNPW